MYMKRRCLLRNNNGFILVSILISTALLLTVATGLAWTARNTLANASSIRLAAEARSAAETALEEIDRLILADPNSYDSYAESLYSLTEPIDIRIGEYRVLATVEPLDGKIPLQGLFLPDGVTIRSEYEYPWKKIWEELGMEDTEAVAADFMDCDTKQRPGSFEAEGWINRPPAHISEMKLIEGISDLTIYGGPDDNRSLSLYFDIYGTEKININTAPIHVIALLDRRIGTDAAESLAYYRLKYPIEKIDDLKKVPGFPAAAISKIKNIIKFKSDHFLIKMTAETKSGKTRNFRITVKKEDGSIKTVTWEE